MCWLSPLRGTSLTEPRFPRFADRDAQRILTAPPPNAAATTGPRLPTRRRAPPASAPRITGGRLAGVLIGAARVRKAFGGELFAGTVTSYQSPFFRVRHTDGDEEDLTGTELASILDYT